MGSYLVIHTLLHRRAQSAFIEHETLVMQRVVGIALGYEDLIDHDELPTIRYRRHWRASSPQDAATVRRWRANRR